MPDANPLVIDVKKILAKDGIWIVQQNYVVGMLQQNAFDNICHEHLEFYSLLSMEKLLNRHGLEIYHVEMNDINGGSFRTYICHKGARPIGSAVLALRESEKLIGLDTPKVYQDFAKRVKIIADNLHQWIDTIVNIEGKKVYTYGASTRGNTLLQFCNLDSKLITAAVERNPEKWGKMYAGSGIPMISEEEARKNPCDYALILPWFFAKEIISRDQELLKSGMKFIIPLPNPTLITKDGEIEI